MYIGINLGMKVSVIIEYILLCMYVFCMFSAKNTFKDFIYISSENINA